MKRSFILVVLLVMACSCAFAGPAQDILGDLAASERSERTVSGLATVGVGAVIGVGGFLLLDDMELGTMAAIGGGLVALPGLVTLIIPSEAELACRRSCDSEVESALALEKMATNAKLERYLSGVVNLAAGLASLLFPYSYVTQYDYIYSAVMNFGLGAVDFLLLSNEERAYERYKQLAPSTG